ncbi:hypothetical protein [Micromonospora sp. DT229]|uniref:hypothetical protein n=1 Tax=Micromonospora sp. DT229 TaxID=3393430 RepID=UPI003CEA83C2
MDPYRRNTADIPETQGAQYLACPSPDSQHLTRTIDPAWLPRAENQLRLTWRQLDTFADTPSASPASWALAVYTAP